MKLSSLSILFSGIIFLVLIYAHCPAGANDNAKTIDSKMVVLKDFQDGDVIFHTSNSSQSKAIQLATNSIYPIVE
ncbi:MAG: hypothetical protein H0X62_00560 [Bacteroidetes bacterium]|nr:hypothetical protein [Bacteroidota bacterium]